MAASLSSIDAVGDSDSDIVNRVGAQLDMSRCDVGISSPICINVGMLSACVTSLGLSST